MCMMMSVPVNAFEQGVMVYKALLYIPSRPPYDYYSADYERGLQLYSAGVMIMDKCQDLIGDQVAEGVLLQVVGILLLLAVFLDVHDDVRASECL